jgi:hypothetical protein
MPGKNQTDEMATIRDPEQLKNLLLVLEHARADAWLRRDKRAIEALLAPGFHEINTFGRFTRDDLLIRLFPVLTLHTFTIEDPALLSAGEGAAGLTYRCYEELSVDGKKMKGTSHVSALYAKTGKIWKLILWQVTPFCSS